MPDLLLEVVAESYDGRSLTVKLPALPLGATSWSLTVTPASTGTPQTMGGLAGGASEVVTGLSIVGSNALRDGSASPDYTFHAVAVGSGGEEVAQTGELLVSLKALPPVPTPPNVDGMSVVFWGFSEDGSRVELAVSHVSTANRTVELLREGGGESQKKFTVGNTPYFSVPVTPGQTYSFSLVASNKAGATTSPVLLKVTPQARLYGGD